MSQDEEPQPASKETPSWEGLTWEEWWAKSRQPGHRRRMSKKERDNLAWVLRLLRRENREEERLEAIEKAAAEKGAVEKDGDGSKR